MDFFENQDAARRSTGRLVVLFGLAVASIIASVYVVIVGVLNYSSPDFGFWRPELIILVGGVTVAVVTAGSLYKIAQLRGGGRVVAELLGSRLVPPDTQDPDERKILNVVEEMAIASGTPVPPVYVMQGEQGINAFAAGYSPDDAVVGVTHGTIERLSREELQGVIAHEFSHILNGDMRLNIHLIGILNGILIIGMIGYIILRGSFFSGVGHRRSRSGKNDGGAGAIIGVAIGLIVVGFLGTVFGNLIKAAVSRQREYLADASAVQFTRSPGGIAGALKKIGVLSGGSTVASPAAAEASHMFFARSLSSGFASMFSTHPRLDDRILRIEPGWDGKYPDPETLEKSKPVTPVPSGDDAKSKIPGILTGTAAAAIAAGAAASASSSAGLVSQIGHPTAAHVAYAARIVHDLPQPLAEAIREPYGARAAIYALLLSPEGKIRQKQFQLLAEFADKGVHDLTQRLLPHAAQLQSEARLPLVDLATPTLRTLSPSQYGAFKVNVAALIGADDRLDLFEWVLQRILLRHLEPHFRKVDPPRVKHHGLKKFRKETSVLISALAYAGHDDASGVAAAFEQAKAHLKLPGLEPLNRQACEIEQVGRALDALDSVPPKLKRRLLNAGVASVSTDGQITVQEAELLRGIADSLGCPMPPLLPEAPAA